MSRTRFQAVMLPQIHFHTVFFNVGSCSTKFIDQRGKTKYSRKPKRVKHQKRKRCKRKKKEKKHKTQPGSKGIPAPAMFQRLISSLILLPSAALESISPWNRRLFRSLLWNVDQWRAEYGMKSQQPEVEEKQINIMMQETPTSKQEDTRPNPTSRSLEAAATMHVSQAGAGAAALSNHGPSIPDERQLPGLRPASLPPTVQVPLSNHPGPRR